MNIIEQNLIGKHSAEDCEDGIVITEDFVAVIDGSTSKSQRRWRPDMKNGRWAMILISDILHRLPADTTLDDFCDQATTLIHKQYHFAEQVTPDIPPQYRICASAVIYSQWWHEVWMIGDCQCMIDGQLYENGKPYEERLARQRAAVFEESYHRYSDMIEDGELVHDYARDEIIPNLIKAIQEENITYAVIDGYTIYKKGVKVINIKNRVTEIVLASDGYPFLKPTLKDSELALGVQMQRDPYNVKTFLATKGKMRGNLSFDDRAYVRFSSDQYYD